MATSVLIVLTSQTRMGDSDIPTGFWMEELATPYYVFQDDGLSITLASPRGGKVIPDPRSLEDESQTRATRRFQDDPRAIERIRQTTQLSDIRADAYDAIVFPGGHGPMYDLANDARAGKLVAEFYDAGKVVAAFCHGPAALLTATDRAGRPLVANKRVTGFSNQEEEAVGMTDKVPFLLENRLKELGGRFSAAAAFEPHVVADGNLITGQNPASARKMADAVLKNLE